MRGVPEISTPGSSTFDIRSSAEFLNQTIPFSHIYVTADDYYLALKKSLDNSDSDDLQEFTHAGKLAIEQHEKHPKKLTALDIHKVSDFHHLIDGKKQINILIVNSFGEEPEEFKEGLKSLKRVANLLAPVIVKFHIMQSNDEEMFEVCADLNNIYVYQNCMPVNQFFKVDFYIELNTRNDAPAHFASLPLANKFQNINPDAPRIGVIIPHYGTQEKLNACLDALLKVEGFDPHWLYIIDNNSHNRYFTIGVNHGLQQALYDSCDFFWVLNNDTQPDTQYITASLERFSLNAQAGIVGGKNLVTKRPDRIFWGGSHNAFPTGVHKAGYVSRNNLNEATQESWATFSSVIIRKETMEDCGLLDSNMRMIFSDSDYCFQAGLHGWQIWYEPKAVILHDTGVSRTAPNQELIQIFRKDKIAFYRKWSTIAECDEPSELQEAIFDKIGFST